MLLYCRWMFVGADNSGNALGLDLPNFRTRLTHARGDGFPPPSMRENEIANGNLFNRNVPSLGANDSAGDEAWVSRQQGVDASPWAGVERLDVIPYLGGVQVSCALPRNDAFARVLLDFDVANGSEIWLCKPKTHVKPTSAGAERESVSGR